MSVGCFVLTVSDTRTSDTDSSGRAIREFVERAGHQVTGFAIVRDEPALVTASVKQWLTDADTRVIITAPASRRATARSRRWTRCSRNGSTALVSSFGC